MAKTIRTVTTTAKGGLPYHFTCNYCGCRNDKVASISGVAIGRQSMGVEALRDLKGEPQRYREKIREYEQRLRDGTALPEGKFDELAYAANSLTLLGLDGTCDKCGKTQAWAISLFSEDGRMRQGCLTMLAFQAGGLVLFLIGAIAAKTDALRIVLMALGGLVWLGGTIGCLAAHFVRKRRDKAARLAELRAAPNDPDKLPVIDEPAPDPWAMGT